MTFVSCFTDCAAATVLAYEKPEADVLLRNPRNPKTDRLVDWGLILQSYGFIGVLESFSSFAMSYWCLQRSGIPFSALWFKYGAVPGDVTDEYYNARLAEASSIYFVNLVVMYVPCSLRSTIMRNRKADFCRQWFSLMSLRIRPPSIADSNLLPFPAIVFALCMAIFWLYITQLQAVLATSRVPAEHFFLPAAFGLGFLLLDEGGTFMVRRWPRGIVAKLAW